MKLQDVILKAMAKKISWLEAAEIVGVTDRTMRRIRERYQEFGYTGLFDQRRGKRSIHRIPMQTAEEVQRLCPVTALTCCGFASGILGEYAGSSSQTLRTGF